MVTNFSNIAVDTTLNGAITNVATSLVVVSATGYPVVPFNIQIENEVIRVGAKSGTTFSTLTRGYDGTTGVAHVDGSAVSHVVIAEDIPPKYGSYILGDVPPEIANADDDEFDDSSLTGWTQQEAGFAPGWFERDDGLLYVMCRQETGWNLGTIHKALPGSGTWSYVLAVDSTQLLDQLSHRPVSLCLIEGTTAQGVYMFGPTYSSGDKIQVVRLDSYSVYNSLIQELPIRLGKQFYLRVSALSGPAYRFEVSTSPNFIWARMGGLGPDLTLPFTPTQIGIGVNVDDATHYTGATVKWFRRTA